jgi:anti-sigma regulatory factor (Ser/Thr protein kinase)
MRQSIQVAVRDPSQVGEARRVANALAAEHGFDATERGKLAIVATEAATNLVKHGCGGELLMRFAEHSGAIELLALDRGPGMSDAGQCLVDGFSTTGSSGTGLGAIQRLSTSFGVITLPGGGTALLARIVPRSAAASTGLPALELGAISVAAPGESVCGDGWAVHREQARLTVMVVDGLGHGPLAAEAAEEAIRVFNQSKGAGTVEILEAAHGALRKTRGAAMAVAQVDRDEATVRFAGVGNISGVLVTDAGSRSMVSHNGLLGGDVRRMHELLYPLGESDLLVMHSDGLSAHWRLDRYTGLMSRDAALIAGVLYRDFSRGRDDATVIVLRLR